MQVLTARWVRTLLVLMVGMTAAIALAQHNHSASGAGSARKPRPQLASSAVFAPDGSLWLVGLNAQRQLTVQSTGPNALSPWSEPRVVSTGGDAISSDGENRPKIAFGPNQWAVISYTQPTPKPYTGMIRMLRSTDGGRSFSAPFTVHADRQEITHRFESIAFDQSGALHTVWIDKRDMEKAPRVGPKSSYRGAAIYRNVSRDGGATFGPDIKVADHSCECCRIALAPGRDGALRALWRHVFEPNIRDHAFARLELAVGIAPPLQAASPIVRVSFDDWRIDACPHHGPGLALAHDGGFHAVWFGIRKVTAENVPAVRYARLQSDGKPVSGTERALPDERAEHADVLASDERVAVVWRSVDGERSALRAWLSSDGGRTFRLKEIDTVVGENDHPRLAQRGERMVVVWRNEREVRAHELQF